MPSFVVAKTLDEVLFTLNQSPKAAIAYPAPLDQNLTALNADEMQRVNAAWQATAEYAAPASKQQARDRKNRFFHDQAQSLNAPLLPWIQSASAGAADHRTLAERVLKHVAKHPIASIESTLLRKRSAEIGFCFGRALLVHYELLQAGVAPSDLVKVFALGELTVEKQHWRFHVAVGVRDPKDGILIVDPLFPEVRGLAQWMGEVAAYDIKHPFSRTRFYVTDPRKFLPALGAYDKAQLTEPILRSYFTALAKTL